MVSYCKIYIILIHLLNYSKFNDLYINRNVSNIDIIIERQISRYIMRKNVEAFRKFLFLHLHKSLNKANFFF